MEEVQGDAAFRSFPGECFRFGVGVVDDVEQLWLENKVSKKRWTCKVADVAAFAPKDVVLPRETVLHYVAASLKESAAAADSADHGPNIIRKDDDQTLQLEVRIKLEVAGFAWTPKYVFPLTLEPQDAMPTEVQPAQQIKLLTTQVQELQQEVKTLKEQMQTVLRAQATSQPEAAVSSSPSRSAESSDVESPRLHPKPTRPLAAKSTQDRESLPTPSRKEKVWGDIIGQPRHRLVQTDEYRETQSSDGVVIRRHRQHACKVCSTLKGDRRRPFETSFYCSECTEQHEGGVVFLCDKVRQHDVEEYQNATCSQIWHVMWNNGKDIPGNGTSIRMRKRHKVLKQR
ncbi:hypothetical protein PF005_g6484 [Phytophthora fragariae]|uniref:Uncharacterized protein n=1 Tax=Phytophthora fragariae TaxID=53985 RepID=A0A6A3ZZV9_9STRA|nr:hypothetical protein PF003_g19063 [Phytophthora fragariae]KAE8943039.1 hypothetical protein PF009_g7223 [Phytophthora fragariae]KAE9020322.1 hypothetical protein PF011_g5460 [Phytophthora fragariae]KAE9124326.1 hypothetical protein PF007_g6759 [Phytophthora fragariae]KAE9125127.1 hypothetical protein PF010_g5746 [Phytophthora fragariae]